MGLMKRKNIFIKSSFQGIQVFNHFNFCFCFSFLFNFFFCFFVSIKQLTQCWIRLCTSYLICPNFLMVLSIIIYFCWLFVFFFFHFSFFAIYLYYLFIHNCCLLPAYQFISVNQYLLINLLYYNFKSIFSLPYYFITADLVIFLSSFFFPIISNTLVQS